MGALHALDQPAKTSIKEKILKAAVGKNTDRTYKPLRDRYGRLGSVSTQMIRMVMIRTDLNNHNHPRSLPHLPICTGTHLPTVRF